MKKYNTIINYIEPTKILQRVTVDTFNNTYPLGHEYDPTNIIYSNTDGINDNGHYPAYDYATIDKVYGGNINQNVDLDNLYKDIYNIGEKINLVQLQVAFVWRETGALARVTKTNLNIRQGNNVLYSVTYDSRDDITPGKIIGSYTVSSPGQELIIRYDCDGYNLDSDGNLTDSLGHGTVFFGTNSHPIMTVNPISPPPRIQLDAVCERIFAGSLGLRENDPVPYKLDAATKQWFSTITAPEYCFTRSTLYEVLMEIGGTKEVNAVPRLLWNDETNAFDTITFVKQGDETDEYTLPAGVKITGEEVDISADDYCEAFDSYAENMVNTLDAQRGSVCEPAESRYKAVLSEDLTITDNSGIIETTSAINRVIKLVASYSSLTADITPYLFETAEYDNLTSYKGAYPYAKEWALRYAQGDNKITGLCLKAETETDLGNSFTKMAIYNILSRVWGEDLIGGGIANISFNITYIPFVTVRTKQFKPSMEWEGSGTTYYNQSGNVVEADYYGNHLKNRLAKTGNPVKKFTFRLKGEEDAPKIGQVYYDEEDDELLYIMQVDEEIGLTYTLITIWCTRNVNKLYSYTAINSRRRQYTIDEKMSVDRHINISEKIYIGDEIEKSDTSISGSLTISDFMAMFYGGDADAIEIALSRGMNGSAYVQDYCIAHSVTCAALGNSLYFGFRFKDNYSAGNQSVSLASAKRMVRAVPYADDNGMFDYLEVKIGKGLPLGATSYDLPECPVPGSISAFSTDIAFSSSGKHGRIPVYKDSRDIIIMDVQEHFIATRKTIIIGSELAFCNRLIRGTSKAFGIAFLPYRLNVQRESLNIQSGYTAGTMSSSDITIDGRKAKIRAYTNTTGAAAKSWAIYNTANKRLVIGENMDIAAGGTSSQLVFNF